MTSVEEYKKIISDRYIEDFKKELGFFDTILVAPIFTKMKDILKSDKKIDVDNLKDLEDLWFWRNVLGIKIWETQLFENLVNKTFNFLKEKQEKILQAETEWRLDELSNLVVNWKLDVLENDVDKPDNQQEWENNQQEWENNQQEWENNQQEWENNQQEWENNQQEWENNQQEWENNQQEWENNQQEWENNQQEWENNQQEWENNQQEWENNQQEWENNQQEWENNQQEWENNQQEWVTPVEGWVAVWVWWGVAYREGISVAERSLWINKLKNAPEEFDAESTKNLLTRAKKQMEELKNDVKVSRAQKKVYEKSIKRFDEAANSLDGETAKALKAWHKLENKIPSWLLKKWFGMNTRTLGLIDELVESLPDEELERVLKMWDAEIIKYFKDVKKIDISLDFAKQLKVAKNAAEIRWLTKILKNSTKLAKVLKWIKWMWIISFLACWFDFWVYLESEKQAELVSKINQVRGEILKDNAKVQLWIWVWPLLLEAAVIIGICAAWWSVAPWIWTAIWVVVWVLSWLASSAYDSLVGEVKEFYAQNRYDFINKKRTEVKQSIVQLFESDRLSMDEGMKESIKDDRGPNSEINTMEDAWEALIYQEEIMEWGFNILQSYYRSWESEESFKKTLSDEDKKQYEEEKKEMENIINIRMEYIKKYVKEDKNSSEYNEMKKALSENKWLEYVEQLLANSKVYAYLKTDHEDAYIQDYKWMDVESYKEAYKQKLSQEYNKEFAIFEKLRQEDPSHLQEICEWTMALKRVIEGNFEDDSWNYNYTEQEKTNLKRNINFVEKYNEYLNLWRPMEEKITTWLSWNTFDYEYIENVLLDFNSIDKRPVWPKENTIRYLIWDEFGNNIEGIDSQVSNSAFQNIIYSIAREIHGYDWHNDKLELINFYTCDWDNTWIYMDDKRKIKDVTWFLFFGAEDSSVDNPDKLTKDQALKMIVWEVDLDSPVEAADDKLTKEFRERVKVIIEREYSYREKKKDYEKQIIDFIKTNNNWQDGYVEIPENLVINAKKAWIWDIHKFLFRVENWQIYALSRWDMTNTVLHFDDPNVKIKYESLNPLRNELTEKEKQLISYVDDMEKKLNKLRRKTGSWLWESGHEDDLDIPVELERIMSQKSIEWDDLKRTILYMDPDYWHDYLVKKSREYYDFFSWMYQWILNRVTTMNHVMWMNSNDINDSANFLSAMQMIWEDIVSVKDWKLEINESISEAIRKHLPDLFDYYKDKSTGKTVKELLMDEDEKNQRIWQELAKKIFELCLEQAALEFDSSWNVTNISTLDFSDNDLEKVKEKLKNGLEWVWFQQAHNEYVETQLQFDFTPTIRVVEEAEVDTHSEIDAMTEQIINTMNDVDRAEERKNPKFIPDEKQKEEWKITWKFSSWWYSEKFTVNMTDSKNIKSVTIDWLWMTFDEPQEWFRTVNLINWIHNNAKENPRWSTYDVPNFPVDWTLWKYIWSGGDLERDLYIDTWAIWEAMDSIFHLGENLEAPNVEVLNEDYLKKNYPKIHEDKDFLNYINNFL